MKICVVRLNLFLILAVVAWIGCQSTDSKRKKVVSTLRVHQEMRFEAQKDRRIKVEIFRARPYTLAIDKEACLNETMVKEAKVLDALGGFALQIQLDRRGTWLLEQFSTAMKGQHLAIFSQFTKPGEEQLSEGRWLAAPLVGERITDGVLIFTPDATREEAEQIALGLNNVSKDLKTGNTDVDWNK